MATRSWTDYWQRGDLTTLNHFRDGYSGELAEFWHAQVERLEDGARVVDLATGNGAVPMVLLQHARTLGLRLELEGVDVADIDPVAHAGRRADWLADLATIRFHPGKPLERTGLPEAHYHLVTSQYGIEYGDLDQAVDEIARLLRPGGRFAAIVHSTDSNVARSARRLDELLDLLLRHLDIPGRMRALLARVGEARDDSDLTRLLSQPENGRAYDDLMSALARAEVVAREDEERAGTLYGFATRLLAPLGAALSHSPEEKLAMVADVERVSRNLSGRMQDLLGAALDRDGQKSFADRLARAGLVPESCVDIVFGRQREMMGYGIVARREGCMSTA